MDQAEAAGIDVSAADVGTALDADATIENDVYSPVDGEADPALDSATGAMPPPANDAAWDEVLTSTTTWDGYYAPTRQGSSRFGYDKACGYHNVCAFKIFNAGYQGYCKEPAGTRCVYKTYIVDSNFNIRMIIRIIYDRSNTSMYGRTSDGRSVGTINAYCEGYTRCPSWVNEVQAGTVLTGTGG